MCTEPAHRFETEINHKLDHNQDFPSNPEQWLCEFCNDDLMKIVRRVCCGETQRKRREIQEIEFWHQASQQNNKLMSKIEHGHSNFHPNQLIHRDLSEDCLDDLQNKRSKRQTTTNNGDGDSDSNQVSHWEVSIENGGKGRSTKEELEALEKITCHKKISNNFLGSGTTYDRKIWKHTYIQRECCGIGAGSKDSCEMDEIQDSYLQEECCNEGCRLEEIYEDCGAWRWDMKEYVEEYL